MSVNRRTFVKMVGATVAMTALPGCGTAAEKGNETNMNKKPIAGTDGDRYIPFDNRMGDEATVYFTRDLSAAGLLKIFDCVKKPLKGTVAVKVHTGEPKGPNIIPRPWIKELLTTRLPKATIVETNTYYAGGRYTTEEHRKTLAVNGWDFATVDITDDNGAVMFPVKGGKWFTEMSIGKGLENYDSFLALTHFKGHTMGGFGGSDKNIGIGCADGRIGKKMIHSAEGKGQWSIDKEEFMERMTESTKAVVDHFDKKIAFINVLRNMSVSCDCEGISAAPVVTPDIGIVASLDILAADQASIDLVYALPKASNRDLVQRIESRHGLRQLSYMKELGMGCDRYRLIDLDNNNAQINAAEAVKGINGTWVSDGL